jgi:hypothetical protein
MNSITDVQVCDACEVEECTEAGNKKYCKHSHCKQHESKKNNMNNDNQMKELVKEKYTAIVKQSKELNAAS